MDDGLRRAARTIALFSRAYLRSVYGQQEWEAALRDDPRGLVRKLVPIRIENCHRPGILGGVVSFDLFELSPEDARERLLGQIAIVVRGRAKPTAEPAFPGTLTLPGSLPPATEPEFPGLRSTSNLPPSRRSTGETRVIAGRYRLGEPLRREGGNIVWRGEDEKVQRPVSIKEIRLPVDRRNRDVVLEHLLHGVRAHNRVHDGAVVSVFDFAAEANRYWIIFEMIDGNTLADIVRLDGPLTPAEVAAIGLTISDALHAIHSAGIIHRNLTPTSILVQRDGRVRLTDFGIASSDLSTTLTGTGELLGTPGYIAPERIRGSSGTPSSDLWELAATLYFAVEGQPAYEGAETYAILTATVEARRRLFCRAGPLGMVLSSILDASAENRSSLQEISRHLALIAK